MNKIERLIQQLCPKGVKFVTLGEISTISSNGVDKKSKANQVSVRLLNYMDVYKVDQISKAHLSMNVTATSAQVRNCSILAGDLFFTPSSETVDDIGHAAVAIEDIPDGVYSYHLHRLRFFNLNEINPNFIRHMFRTSFMQKQIRKSASGMTRFGLTKGKWEALVVPLPPLVVQNKIVSILDRFNQLEAELEAELEGRTSLFKALRAKLFEEASIVSKAELGSLCDMYSGEFVKKDRQGNDFLYPVYNGGSEPTGFYSEFNSLENSIVIASRGSIGSVSFVTTPFWAGNSCFVLKNPIKEVNYRYLYHYLKHSESELYKLRAVGTIPALNLRPLLKFEVPIPDLMHQERISSSLDKFEQFELDIQLGLPAEIRARRKQYEYYRNKLITFKELDAA